jgi:hypothetical protein
VNRREAIVSLLGVAASAGFAASEQRSPNSSWLVDEVAADRAVITERDRWLREWIRGLAADTRLNLVDRAHLILGLDEDFDLGDNRGWLFSSTSRSATVAGVDGFAPWLLRTASGWTVRAAGSRRKAQNGEAHPAQFLCCMHESLRFLDAWAVTDPSGTSLSPRDLARGYLPAVAGWTDLDSLIPALVAFDDRHDWSVGSRTLSLGDLASLQLARGPGEHCFGTHWWWSLLALRSAGEAGRLDGEILGRIERALEDELARLSLSAAVDGAFVAPENARGDELRLVGARVSYVGHTLAWALRCGDLTKEHARSIRRAARWLAETGSNSAPDIGLSTLCHACHALRLSHGVDALWRP